MTKNIQHVSFHPIEHAWVGDHEINKKDNWVELGHFLRGMEIVGEPVVEQDGRKRFQEALGYLLSGTFQNIQNTVGELQFYRKVLNGTKNFAFRNGSVLTLFRLYQVAPGVVGDNRASFKTKAPDYGDKRLRAQTEIGGFIEDFEQYTVIGDVTVVNGALNFKAMTDPVYNNNNNIT